MGLLAVVLLIANTFAEPSTARVDSTTLGLLVILLVVTVLDRVNSLEAAGVKVEFSEKLQGAAALVTSTLDTSSDPPVQPSVDAVGTLREARVMLEAALAQYAASVGVGVRPTAALTAWKLREVGALEDRELALLNAIIDVVVDPRTSTIGAEDAASSTAIARGARNLSLELMRRSGGGASPSAPA